jgi:hypothetical protein
MISSRLAARVVREGYAGWRRQPAKCVGVETRSSERIGNAEALTDSANGPALERGVPGNWSLRSIPCVHPNIVIAASVMQETPFRTKVAFKIAALHAERRRAAANFRSNFAREARRPRRASCAIRNASSIVSASVMSSGSTGLVTTNPPSSAVVRVRTSLPSETV